MKSTELAHGIAGACIGVLAVVFAVYVSPSGMAQAVGVGASGSDDLDGLRNANANLLENIQRTEAAVMALRVRRAPLPLLERGDAAPPPMPQPSPPLSELTKEEWERSAGTGSISLRTPCLRDKVWSPPPSLQKKLELSVAQVASLRIAYEHSNKRLAAVAKPLCTAAVGSGEVYERIGAKACAELVLEMSTRADEAGMQRTIQKIAGARLGKEAPKTETGRPIAERLLEAMANENTLFAAELNEKLGSRVAERVLSSREMCGDTTVLAPNRTDGASPPPGVDPKEWERLSPEERDDVRAKSSAY